MLNLPKRYQTVYECKIGQGQQGNCFKWALERVLSKIVFTIIYSVNVIPVTLKYTTREQMSEPLPAALTNQVSKETTEQVATRIGLAQFFGEWIALYCGNEGDIKDAYVDVNADRRMTDADAYSDDSMCGLFRPQYFANTPEVLMYNFSRIVNFILDDIQNLECHIHRLLAMKYPICLGIVDPTFSDITQKANYFLGSPSGVEDKTYAIIVKDAFTKFFTDLRKNKAYLDLKTVTLHRKPYVILYKDDGNTQILVPQIDISVGNVALKEADLKNPSDRLKNNYFEEIAAQIEIGFYAEISVYMPKAGSPVADKYFKSLVKLTESVARQKMMSDTMTTRSGNLGEKREVKSMASQLPDGPDMSGHSMALRGIHVDKKTKKIYIIFINSWDDQEYVEYPVNIFFRVDLHALLIIDKNPEHIRTLDAGSISTKYMEISTYVPSCIPEYMLQMVASNDNSFYRNENAEDYRVRLTKNQHGWANQPISPIKKVRSIDSDSESENELDETFVDSPSMFSQDESWRNESSQEESQNKRLKTCELKPNNLSFEEPMEVCTPEKCKNLPVLESASKKRKLINNYINDNINNSDTEIDDFDGGKKKTNKTNKTNKRRAKPRKRVTRKLKKKRATCRLNKCRIFKRRTYKKQNKPNKRK